MPNSHERERDRDRERERERERERARVSERERERESSWVLSSRQPYKVSSGHESHIGNGFYTSAKHRSLNHKHES